MPNQLQKSLQDYLSKMMKPTPQVQSPSTSRTLSSSTSWILRGCKHPKTPSFAFDDNNESETKQDTSDHHHGAATLSDIDRFLLENFKSLYKNEEDGEDSVEVKKTHDGKNEEKPFGLLSESPRFMDPPEINLCGSHRFFVARASSSGSLIEETRTSLTTSTFEDVGSSYTTTTTSANNERFNDSTRKAGDDDVDEEDDDEDGNKVLSPDDFITVFKYSPSPYDDFKKSMHDMIDERLHRNGKIDWEFLEELLFCYLNLNEKKSYRFILRAFVDVVLRENSSRVPAQPRSVGSNSGSRKRRSKNN